MLTNTAKKWDSTQTNMVRRHWLTFLTNPIFFWVWPETFFIFVYTVNPKFTTTAQSPNPQYMYIWGIFTTPGSPVYFGSGVVYSTLYSIGILPPSPSSNSTTFHFALSVRISTSLIYFNHECKDVWYYIMQFKILTVFWRQNTQNCQTLILFIFSIFTFFVQVTEELKNLWNS